MPNVVIVRNTYPDDQSMKRVLHYVLDKAVTVGAYGTSPNVEAAYMQMQFVKRAFYQTDALQLKHFFITYSHEEAMYIDFNEMMLTAFEAGEEFKTYQMVYGLHLDGSHVHVHIVMSTFALNRKKEPTITGIQHCREMRNMSKGELADNLGIKTPDLWRYENGKRRCPVGVYQRMASILNVTIDELLMEYAR